MRTIGFCWFLSYVWETGRRVSTGLTPTGVGVCGRLLCHDASCPGGCYPRDA